MIDSALAMLVVGGVSMGAGLLARFGFTPSQRIRRALKGVRPTAIAEVRDGRAVKIVGEVAYAGRSLVSPLSRRSCAYYAVLVQQHAPRSGRGGPWRDLVREERGVDFYVRDGSGVALVRVTERSVWAALVRDRAARTSAILHSDQDLERLLTERGHSTEGALFRKNLRAYEGVIAEGERVAVGGLARWVPDPDAASPGYRETGKRLVLQASEALPLFLSDDPRAL